MHTNNHSFFVREGKTEQQSNRTNGRLAFTSLVICFFLLDFSIVQRLAFAYDAFGWFILGSTKNVPCRCRRSEPELQTCVGFVEHVIDS